jgi:hypothetical protein
VKGLRFTYLETCHPVHDAVRKTRTAPACQTNQYYVETALKITQWNLTSDIALQIRGNQLPIKGSNYPSKTVLPIRTVSRTERFDKATNKRQMHKN